MCIYVHTTELYSDVHLVGMYKHVQILVCTNMHSTTECKSMKDLYRSVQVCTDFVHICVGGNLAVALCFVTESKKRAGVAQSSAAVLDGQRRLYSPKKRAGVAQSYSTLARSKN